jgi:hypothetical protein
MGKSIALFIWIVKGEDKKLASIFMSNNSYAHLSVYIGDKGAKLLLFHLFANG